MNWEYKTIKVGMTGILGRKLDERELEATMNQLGRQGWELGVRPETPDPYVFH